MTVRELIVLLIQVEMNETVLFRDNLNNYTHVEGVDTSRKLCVIIGGENDR